MIKVTTGYSSANTVELCFYKIVPSQFSYLVPNTKVNVSLYGEMKANGQLLCRFMSAMLQEDPIYKFLVSICFHLHCLTNTETNTFISIRVFKLCILQYS